MEKSQVEAARTRASTDAIIKLKSAVLAVASAKLERMRTLRAQTIASQQSVDDAESAAALAESEL